jgi:hypothetical protein
VRRRVRRAAWHLCMPMHGAVRAVDKEFHTAIAIYTRLPLKRAFRDVRVAVQYAAALPGYFESAGKVLFGLRVVRSAGVTTSWLMRLTSNPSSSRNTAGVFTPAAHTISSEVMKLRSASLGPSAVASVTLAPVRTSTLISSSRRRVALEMRSGRPGRRDRRSR